ncbi:hypothetical protein BH09VER1_BH09VER1_34780 [soil metagenome]
MTNPLKTLATLRNPASCPRENRRELRRLPAALPTVIARRLTALASRVLRISWAEGLLWLIAALCVLVLVQGALDWLYDLSRGVRFLFVLGDLAIFGALIYLYGVLPWLRRLTPEEAALRAERHWPALRSGLISAVQLARRPGGSPTIVQAMLAQMANRISHFDLRLAVRWRRLKKLLIITLLLVVITAGLIAWLAPKSIVLLQRIALLNVPLPTETVVMSISKDISTPTGQTIELAARASGVIPRSGRVEVTYEGKSPEFVTVTPKASSPDTFSLQLANIQQPLTYRFSLNDGRGEEWTVKLIHPPVIKEIQFDATSPAYADLPPTRLLPGSLSLLAGSKLKISGKSNQSLKSARLVLTGKERSIDLKPEGADHTEFNAMVDISKEGLDGLWVELRNEQGTVSQDNTIYALQIIPDKPPEIILADGQPEKANLVATQKPHIKFEVRDDFKVQQVFLCVQSLNTLGEGENPDPAKAKLIPITVPKAAAHIAFDFEWSDPEKTVDWAEGQSFAWWIKAVDNNDVTGPGVTISSPRQWSVVSLQTKRDELAAQLRKNAESIKDLSGAQESVRKSLGEWLKQDNSKK